MTYTRYHSKYLAYELTKRLAADRAEKLAQSLSNATVDLNPHQIEAALFAFRSPLSRGAILADEVGLGKTIEAGLIVSQLWAEKKRRILCLVPAALRKQWNRELADKFFIDSLILESKNYKDLVKKGSANPFEQSGQVVICSYQFACSKVDELRRVPWDLVVIDEAHRLRNVYKKSSKIARTLRDAIGDRPKALLTATPLQNSLMELFGLVSFVDPHIFGSEESFRDMFAKRTDNLSAAQYANLRARIQPVCQRTLRKQVTEYVRYTRRIPITQDFTPTDDEQRLYEQVSAYLQKPELFALPSSQRQLITLVLRKILASSSFAISATLGTMIDRLEILKKKQTVPADEDVAAVVGDDFEEVDEMEDEWAESEGNATEATADDPAAEPTIAPADIGVEIEELKHYKSLAESIQQNAKGDALLVALRNGFAKAKELGAPQKALIFTESRRTQTYLRSLLEANGYRGQIVLFNGTNSDPESKQVYQQWLARHAGDDHVSGSPTADMRSALVEEFQERAPIMIATESAAEGVNLQFCNLVVNYDLPWNPQRIEQRIGRCHRYGQNFDVVVINFLNRANEADQRVFQLLHEKFRLFDGVFGASDEVLGALETGIDIEKRINAIYQTCRSSDEIRVGFEQLQSDLEEKIGAALSDARAKLMENFDEDVHRRLRLRQNETQEQLNRYGEWLWKLTQAELGNSATFDAETYRFTLSAAPAGVPAAEAPLGRYSLAAKTLPGEHHYRPGHPLAQTLVAAAKSRPLECRELTFDYAQRNGRVALVESLIGKSGWLRVRQLSVTALETEDSLLFAGVTDDGIPLDHEVCTKLLGLPADTGPVATIPEADAATLEKALAGEAKRVLDDAMERNQTYFDAESEKLDRWAEDLKDNLESEIKDLERDIRDAKKQARLVVELKEKIEAQKRIKDLEHRRNEKRKSLFIAQDEIESKKDALIADVEARLEQLNVAEDIFTIRWRLH
jgi:superfamily II DNA or RNA helicase